MGALGETRSVFLLSLGSLDFLVLESVVGTLLCALSPVQSPRVLINKSLVSKNQLARVGEDGLST
jgi:hypothetical protein